MKRCFYDPRKACGSYSRSRLAYDRATLVDLAESCGIRNASQFTMNSLCRMLRDIHFEQVRAVNFPQRVAEMRNWPIPSDAPVGQGGPYMDVAEAVQLADDPTALQHLERLDAHDARRRALSRFILLDDDRDPALDDDLWQFGDLFRAKMLLHREK